MKNLIKTIINHELLNEEKVIGFNQPTNNFVVIAGGPGAGKSFITNNLINLNNVNSFGGVPLFYEYLNRLNLNSFNLKSIKYLTQAGGSLDIDIKKKLLKIFKQKKIKFYIMYGQTEAGPRITTLNLNKNEKKIHSVGRSLKNISVFMKISFTLQLKN